MTSMTRLTRFLASPACLLVLALLFIAGCNRDPNVKKQKFMAQGNEDFDKGKYSEAATCDGSLLSLTAVRGRRQTRSMRA